MKRIKFALPVLLLLVLGFALAGCPKSDKMMDASKPQVEHLG